MPNKRSSTLKLPVLDGKDGLAHGVDPLINLSMLDAMDDGLETHYLLSEPANAAHLLRSIAQHRKGKKKVIRNAR